MSGEKVSAKHCRALADADLLFYVSSVRLARVSISAVLTVFAVACCRANPQAGEGAAPAASSVHVVIGSAHGEPNSPPNGASPQPSASAATPSSAAPVPSAPSSGEPTEPAPLEPSVDAGERPLHFTTTEDLLSLFTLKKLSEKEIKRRGDPDLFLHKNFGPDGPAHINQGNSAIAHHAISRAQCLAGLEGIVIQTKEQRDLCGADNMVPIYKHGDETKAKTCIDVFEFPNKECELPFVWISPVQAQAVCEMQGKRLCAQEEWTQACKGDPEGKHDSLYAYGDEMDLTVCNTNKAPRDLEGPKCEPESASSAWRTCGTNTEPTGSFPRCRSRLGVFDQHGNVAEIMTRYDPEESQLVSQLKGSAFFYVDVARKHNERPPKDATHETYPDHCAYDPRWHVEKMDNAWHVNYHLGFRCCKTVK